jgi:hypothetical protein
LASERAPSLAEVARRALDGRLATMHTNLPVVVTAYDHDTRKVSVQPLVKQLYLTEDDARVIEALPVITGVPVQFPGGGGFTLSFPISDGNLVIEGETLPATTGLLQITEASLDRWLSSTDGTQVVDPEIYHRFALTDGVFTPELLPFGATTSVAADHVWLGTPGGKAIHVHRNLICIGDETDSDWLALAAKVLANDNALYDLLDGVFGSTSTPIVAVTPGSPDPVYVAVKAALAAKVILGTLPPASVAAEQAKGK